jgi:uncharacterized protein YneF (UPF0154 family)
MEEQKMNDNPPLTDEEIEYFLSVLIDSDGAKASTNYRQM